MKNKVERIIEKHRKGIPERYNQNKLLEFLLDDEVDHYFSISNRTDGKSYNYNLFFHRLAMQTDLKFMILVRHYTLRQLKIVDNMKMVKENFDLNRYYANRTDFYVQLTYDNKEIGIITDLNAASDLKVGSQFLENYPILIYDEFLALEADYLPDEYEKIKLIYSSIDRKKEFPFIGKPKIFYFGNAENFDSPILSGLNIFELLEQHKMDTVKKYGNKVIEINQNTNANEDRNLRAFNEEEDPLTTAKFLFNNKFIITQGERSSYFVNPSKFTIKLDEFFLHVTYDNVTKKILLGIGRKSEYNFCTKISDIKDGVKYLEEEKFTDEKMGKKYRLGRFLFENSYSKKIILNDERIYTLKLYKIIAMHKSSNKKPESEKLSESYQIVKQNNALDRLNKMFENGI